MGVLVTEALKMKAFVFLVPFFSVLTGGLALSSASSLNEMKIHFADTVRDLETLSQDAEKMFKRAEQSLMQVDKMDNDQQGYFLDFLIEQIATAITQCNNAPFYPDVCKLEPEVRRLQYQLRDKVNYGKRRHALCKTMGSLAVEIQNQLKFISDIFVKVTNESFEMVNILEMMEYDHYNPLWREQMEQAKDDFIDRMTKMKNMQTLIRGIMAVVEVVIIALTPPDPVTIILEVISIGIALAESIKQQRQYRDQLKEAKRKMTIALADVTRANGRIDEECHKIETSWAELLGNGRKTLDNVNAVTKKLREIMPNLYGGVSSDQLTLSSNKAFEPYNARGIKGQTDNIKSFMVDQLYPRINGALEDLFGKFTLEQLPTMVWVTNEVVNKVKINATIEDIVSEVKPKDRRFSNVQIMHLVGKMFPKRQCYQYYPLAPARSKVIHPTYDVQNINHVASILQTALFYSPLKSDCSNMNDIVTSAKRIECNCPSDCACTKAKSTIVYEYIIACLRPDTHCAAAAARGVHICSGRN